MKKTNWIRNRAQSVKRLYQRINRNVKLYKLNSQSNKIKRGINNQCWCGGELLPFEWHPGYGVCSQCGCYVNKYPPQIGELQHLYSFKNYWHNRIVLKGQPAIEDRPAYDRNEGRVDYWMSIINKYGPSSGRAIEVGCAHGVLLSLLKSKGYDCIGVEPDEATSDWTRKNMGIEMVSGFFPDVKLPNCDIFLSFDVLEHSPHPDAFMIGAAKLLNPGGIIIIQTPINRYDTLPPFGERFKHAFEDIEHLYLFTDKSMTRLSELAHLHILDMTQRLMLHHEICVFSKSDEE